MHRGRPRVGRGLILAAVFTGPVWVAGTVAALVRTYWAGWLMVIATVLAIVVAGQLFPEGRLGIAACGVVSALAAIVTFIWMPLAVLDLRGEPMTAVVTTERVVRGRHNLYRSELLGPGGRPIPGLLTEYDDVYAPGDRVDVVVDRRQRLDTVTAAELGAQRETGIGAAGLLLLATALSVGVGSRADMRQIDLRVRFRYRPRH